MLNINTPYFEQRVSQIYPTELELNKANSFDTEALFLNLDLSITNGIVSSKICDFDIVNFLFLEGGVPRSPSYSVYISHLIRFARVCYNVLVTSTKETKILKLLKQGYRYSKLR